MLTAANKLAGTDYSRFLAVDSIDAETISKAKEIFNRYLSHGIITGGRFEDDEFTGCYSLRNAQIIPGKMRNYRIICRYGELKL